MSFLLFIWCLGAQAQETPLGFFVVEREASLSSDQKDFSPFFISKKDDLLVFTSNRPNDNNKKSIKQGKPTMDLWFAEKDGENGWKDIAPLAGAVNTPQSEGAGCIDKKFKDLYFTTCSKSKRANLGCDLYVTHKKGTSWTNPELIDLKRKKQDTMVIGHPALLDGGKVIIFASDMGGGEGGVDLWKVEYDKRLKTYGEPVNLGPNINSKGNDMFPFVHANGQLYFASDGHGGSGGLDIVVSRPLQGGVWSAPSNMGAPINSESDDYGIVFESGGKSGYFSSNRQESTQDDIYRFDLKE